MSCYEWERGEFKIPSAEWASFKAKVRTAVNKCNEIKYEMALHLHEAVIARRKKDKSVTLHKMVWEEAHRLNRISGGRYTLRLSHLDDLHDIVGAVYVRKSQADPGTIRKPKKKDFPQHGNTVTQFDAPDVTVRFDNATRKVFWTVHENNYACETARASALGKAFFRSLDTVKWTRGTGGEIYGNNEYNRDANYAGGGANFSKGIWGPKAKKEKPTSSFRF